MIYYMDYIKILPLNVHEEILKRVDVSKPYDFMEEQNNYCFVRSTDFPKDIVENVSLYTTSPDFLRNEERIEIYLGYYSFANNIFHGSSNYSNGYHIYFKGDCKVYLPNIGKIINLTQNANQKLLNIFMDKIRCDICEEKFNFKIEKNLLQIENYISVNDKCLTYSTNNRYQNYSNWCRLINMAHSYCLQTCNSCDKPFCKYCMVHEIITCESCKGIYCKSPNCSCIK